MYNTKLNLTVPTAFKSKHYISRLYFVIHDISVRTYQATHHVEPSLIRTTYFENEFRNMVYMIKPTKLHTM